MAVLLVVTGAAVPAVTARPVETATPDGTDARSNGSANGSAGERLHGAIGAQEAEVDGEIRTRRFGIRTARAASDDAKAAVVAEELEGVEHRLDALEERKQRLQQARDAGVIGPGRYRAEMATIAVETGTARSLVNASAAAAEGLPTDVRERRGLDATTIGAVSERANELAGLPTVQRGGTTDGATDWTGNRTATPRTDGTSTAGHGPASLRDRTV